MTEPTFTELEVLQAIGSELKKLNKAVETIRLVVVVFLLLTLIAGLAAVVMSA